MHKLQKHCWFLWGSRSPSLWRKRSALEAARPCSLSMAYKTLWSCYAYITNEKKTSLVVPNKSTNIAYRIVRILYVALRILVWSIYLHLCMMSINVCNNKQDIAIAEYGKVVRSSITRAWQGRRQFPQTRKEYPPIRMPLWKCCDRFILHQVHCEKAFPMCILKHKHDRIILLTSDHNVHGRLLRESKLTLNSAIDMCRTSERTVVYSSFRMIIYMHMFIIKMIILMINQAL